MDGDTLGRMAYLVLLLVAVGGWVMVEYRKRLGMALRTAMAWGLIFLGVMAGYGLWNDIRQDVLPRQMVTEGGTVELPRALDGHYYAQVDINGTGVLFLADTGASNMVLSRRDADRLGIKTESLVFAGQASTANGTVRTARVTLPEVVLGPFRDSDFAAYVTDGEMDVSLLGMDYLRRFRVEIDGGKMILSR
ncbi:retropepsin-like aspartic protease family protein [Pseudogemmobacter blasticus]|uniref:TIGR02281 family clan AA aspartic protease n=1 Tax=Fuscovulum blasticum DSM 2131 TaxID=1188250 RepID=A0A2T4JAT2_FUSBL|nr:TIGR02281 family clan AA aspartic protease [Fuscovulum blasticum]PTE15004.1 TIGR02281 family clan AA aspartic protease [Fuscovulum blasticum DSM 2131]